MRSNLIFAVLLASTLAQAQYAPHSLSAGPQVSGVVGTGQVMGGISLEGSQYLENSFEFFGRVPLLIAQTPVGADTPTGAGRVFSTGGSLGVRYLLVEGMVRPWVALQLSGVVLLTQPEAIWFLGAGTTLGIDWVLSESWSVGARGIYDVFVDLNRPWRHQLGLTLTVSVLF